MIQPRLVPAAALAIVAFARAAHAQYPYPSRVELSFNRYYDHAEMTQALRALTDAYPELLTMQSLGQSVGGRDIWLVTLNNPETGPDTAKPAMFIDGNIHGNEVQGAETVLYSIWYLTKSYGQIETITKLVDERAFYFVPMENPDGRDTWFHQPATPHYLRGGLTPTDTDHDGLYDEDPYDDLDGDGHITTMWVRDPLGQWKPDPKDQRFMIRTSDDEPPGGWTWGGSEGIDNDGDGDINEDGPGGYDPNRDWPSDWQPSYIQWGARDYPFSLPESRAVADFVFTHPNIAAYQSYHNYGGMILRGPGASYVSYPNRDVRIYDAIGETGALLIPFYNYWIIHQDLYTVHGGEINWVYEGLGILSFTNEIWTDPQMFADREKTDDEHQKKFRDLLQFGDVYVPYKEFEHPTLGTILLGGTTKYASRVTPPWLLEEQCHRNFAFTMHHADQMPHLDWGALQVRSLGDSLWEVTVEVTNDREIPTILALAQDKRIGARDYLDVAGEGLTVVASGTVENLRPDAKLQAVEDHPERIWNDGGIWGKSGRLFRILIAGDGELNLRYWSQKGGEITRTIPLAETFENPHLVPKNPLARPPANEPG